MVKTGPSSHRLQNDGSPEIVKHVTGVMNYWPEKSGGYGNGAIRVTQKSSDHACAIVQAPHLKENIEYNVGVSWTLSRQRVVPDAILQGDRDSVRAFLRGYFDGDGGANPIVHCRSSSRVLAEQIQQLLLGLGVFCGIRTRTTTQGLPAHMVLVYDIDAFEVEVGFTRLEKVKDRFYDAALAKKRNPNHDVVPRRGIVAGANSANTFRRNIARMISVIFALTTMVAGAGRLIINYAVGSPLLRPAHPSTSSAASLTSIARGRR